MDGWTRTRTQGQNTDVLVAIPFVVWIVFLNADDFWVNFWDNYGKAQGKEHYY